MLVEALLEQQLFFDLILICTVKILIVLPKDLEFVRVSFAVELYFTVTLLCNAKVTCSQLAYLLIKAVQV